MATILEQEDQDQQGQQDPQTSGAPQQTAGGGGGATMPGAQAPAYQPQQKGSGRFTNIRKYIQANQPQQGTGAGERMAGKIGQRGEQAASRVREGIEASQSRFGQEVAGRGQEGQLAGGQLYEGVQAGRQAAQAAYGSETGELGEEQRQQFGQLYGGQLQQDIGDVDVTGYTQPVQSQAQDLQKMAQSAGTERGRFGLLRGTFGRPGEQYSMGQQRLDELFLQGTPAAGQLGQQLGGIAKQVGQETTGLSEELTSRQQALAEMAGQERTAAEQLLTQGQVAEGYEGEQYGGGLEDINAILADRLGQMRTDVLGEEGEEGTYDRLRKSLEHNQMFEDIADNPIYDQISEIAGPTGQIYNLNLADYITGRKDVESTLDTATPEQLAKQQEYERFKNIAGLLGREGMAIGEEDIGKFNPYALKQGEGQEMTELERALGSAREGVSSSKQEFADRISGAYDQYANLMNQRAKSDQFSTREDARVMATQLQYGFNQMKQAVDAYNQSGDETHLNEAKNIYKQIMDGPAQNWAEQNRYDPIKDLLINHYGYVTGRAGRSYLDPQAAAIAAANQQLADLQERRRLFASDDTTPYDKLSGIYDPTNIVDDSILKGKG